MTESRGNEALMLLHHYTKTQRTTNLHCYALTLNTKH